MLIRFVVSFSFKPVWTRLQELMVQKAVLTKLYQAGQREHHEVRDLMESMTGIKNAPDGIRLLAQSKRAIFRAGVIAVLAARRLAGGPHRNGTFGHAVQVRGEQFSLLDNQQLSNDAALPAVDDSSLAASAHSLVHLLAHFEPFAAATSERSRRSLLSSISSARSSPMMRPGGEDDRSALATIRRVAHALHKRNRQLEQDVNLAVTEAWASKEQAKVLMDDMTRSNAQFTMIAREQLDSERRRVAQLEHEHAVELAQIRRLEEQLAAANADRSTMVSANEFQEVRANREEYAQTARELESQCDILQRQLQGEREKAKQSYGATIEGLEAKLQLSSKRLADLVEENQELQASLRKKAADLATVERDSKAGADLHSELQSNLQQCMSKNQQLIERIRILERELQEHREFSHKLKSSALQQDSARQQHELQLSHLQLELKEKERELSKAQDLIRTLTAATRAATNELDTQMHYARHIARRPSLASTPSGAPSAYAQPPLYPVANHASPSLSHTYPLPPSSAAASKASGLNGTNALRFDELPTDRASTSTYRQDFAPVPTTTRAEAKVERE